MLAFALIGVSGIALSSPITYDFTVTAINGPLNGDVETGSFTFDSSVIPAGGGLVNQTGLLSDLSFIWDGIVYTSFTANTGNLGFNADGTLRSLVFGTNCGPGNDCEVGSGVEGWSMFGTATDSGFLYATVGAVGGWNGIASFSPALAPTVITPVPEPATLSLLALGLAGIGLTRRRKKP